MNVYILLVNILLFALQVLANDSNLLADFAETNRKFTTDVYREVIKSDDGNLLICPLSAEIILGLAKIGAKGNTSKQLALHINYNNDGDTRHMFTQLNKELETNDKYTLLSANNIFLSNKYIINNDFKEIARDDFKAAVQNVDFSKTKEAVNLINTWVEQGTQHKIRDLLSPSKVTADTAAVFVNAMYFHGNWIHQFDPRVTFKKEFYVNDETTYTTEMMSTEAYFNYHDSKKLNAQFLEIPFEGDDMVMTIVLPYEKFGLHKLENQISDVLSPINYDKDEVEIIIPKFKMGSQINFVPVLQSMGVSDAFTSKADFSGITRTKPPLVIDQVVQKTFFEINEKGATAAASTAVVLTPFSLPDNTFTADHPFLFFLKHKTAGIVFIGKFVTPTVTFIQD